MQNYNFISTKISERLKQDKFGMREPKAKKNCNLDTNFMHKNKLYIIELLNQKGYLEIDLIRIDFEGLPNFEFQEKHFSRFRIKLKLAINTKELYKIKYVPHIKAEVGLNPYNSAYSYLIITHNDKKQLFIIKLQGTESDVDINYFKIGLGMDKILSVQWYPFSESHLCVLEENQMWSAFNIESNLLKAEYSVNLNNFKREKFIDFKFNPQPKSDLSNFTLFLLTIKRQIVLVYPIILNKMKLSSKIIATVKNRLVNMELGEDFQQMFQLLSNKVEGIELAENLNKAIYTFSVRKNEINLNQIVLKSQANQNKNLQRSKFEILTGFKFSVFLISKYHQCKQYSTVNCVIYPEQITILQNNICNYYKLSSLHLELGMPGTSVSQCIDESRFPKILNTSPLSNKIFALSYNRIFSFNISGIRQLQEKMSTAGLTQKGFDLNIFFEKPIIKSEALKTQNYGFYGVYLKEDVLCIIVIRQQEVYLEFRSAKSAINLDEYARLSEQSSYFFNSKVEKFIKLDNKKNQPDFNIQHLQKKTQSDINTFIKQFVQSSVAKIDTKLAEVTRLYFELRKIKEEKVSNQCFNKLNERLLKIKQRNKELHAKFYQKTDRTSSDSFEDASLEEKIQNFRNRKRFLESNKQKCLNINDITKQQKQSLQSLIDKAKELRYDLLQSNIQ